MEKNAKAAKPPVTREPRDRNLACASGKRKIIVDHILDRMSTEPSVETARADVITDIQCVAATVNVTNKVVNLNLLYTRADVITDIQWVAIIANITNKVFDLNVLFTRADVITDILWIADIASATNKAINLNVLFARVDVITDIQ